MLRKLSLITIFFFAALSFSNPFGDLKKAKDVIDSIVKDKDKPNAETTNRTTDNQPSSPNDDFERFAKLFYTDIGSEIITEKNVKYDDFGDEKITYKHHILVNDTKVYVIVPKNEVCDKDPTNESLNIIKQGFPFTVKLPVPYPRRDVLNFKLFNGKKGYSNDPISISFKEDYFYLNASAWPNGPLVDEVDVYTKNTNALVHLRREFEKSLSTGNGSKGDITLIAYPKRGDKIIYKFSPFHSSWIEILKNCKDYPNR